MTLSVLPAETLLPYVKPKMLRLAAVVSPQADCVHFTGPNVQSASYVGHFKIVIHHSFAV